jgi:reductive dehalogenase
MSFSTIQILNIILLGFFAFFFLYAALISKLEKENYAAIRFLFSGILVLIGTYFIVILNPFYNNEVLLFTDIAIVIVFLFLFLPLKNKFRLGSDIPKIQFDERDIMFSRNELRHDKTLFNEYYERNPQLKPLDDEFRKKPGLLSPKSSKYDPLSFSAANANFETVKLLKNGIDGVVNNSTLKIDTNKTQNFIINWAKKLGAHNVGITELKDYHFYHTKGRGETYNEKVENKHKYAIAFTVEMNKEMMDTAPDGPTVMESAQQYLSSGVMAIQIANFIRSLGYDAKAHIDGNYDVVCPLVARDAGLGEIGRMGLLMTPKLGPRVRIATISTDFPFTIKKIKKDISTIHFCEICKKCADNCPSKSIAFDSRSNTDNGLRWQINSEACFTYWSITGTDCGKCIRVCPFSHPNNLLHNFIRFGIKNNFLFRHLALKLDDFYYGRKPKSYKLNWIN